METAGPLAAQLRAGTLAARALMERTLERAGAAGHLNAFISIDAEAALQAAHAADAARRLGHPLGPLHGLPVFVKDNIAVEGAALTAASPALGSLRAAQDATVIRHLRKAGAIPIGRTNMHELAFGITSDNAAHGAVRNPWSVDRMAGGSSGGTAAAIAAGIGPLGLGTDTGGSGRIPASFCGCVGFRPTTGRYPNDGLVMLSHTRDTVAAMGASVADVTRLDAVLGAEPDRRAHAAPANLRLGVVAPARSYPPDGAVAEAMDRALHRLRRAGIELVEVSLEEVTDLDARISFPLTSFECRRILLDLLPSLSHATPAEFVAAIASADVRAIVDTVLGHPVAPEFYERVVLPGVQAMRDGYEQLFASTGIEAILFPATPCTAPPVGTTDVGPPGRSRPLFEALLAHSSPATVAGLPALSLPMGPCDDGLPIGLELTGRRHGDGALLQLAGLVEEILAR